MTAPVPWIAAYVLGSILAMDVASPTECSTTSTPMTGAPSFASRAAAARPTPPATPGHHAHAPGQPAHATATSMRETAVWRGHAAGRAKLASLGPKPLSQRA